MSGACLGVRIVGPLALHADGFRSWLSGQWYATATATEQIRLTARVSRWMASQELDCRALTDEVVAEFLRTRRRAGYRKRLSPKALMPLLAYLRTIGAVLSWGRHRNPPVDLPTEQLHPERLRSDALQ